MTGWVKMPLDLFAQIRCVRLEPRIAFLAWFPRARRHGPQIGYLLDGEGETASTALLAKWANIPTRAARAHRARLHERGLLQRDLLGGYLVPLVIETERRYSRDRETTRTTTAGQPGTKPSSGAVENQTLLPTPAAGRGPPKVSEVVARRPLSTPPLLSGFLEPSRDVRSVVDEGDGENPDDLAPVLVADWADRVPTAVESPDIRYLLGKLAHRSPVWERILGAPRDRSLVCRLHRDYPAALQQALQQASEQTTQWNAGAWLARTVPAIARAQAS